MDDEMDADKRSAGASGWNKMQGVWGKRSSFADDEAEADDPADMDKRSWNQLQGVWGKRSSTQMVPRPIQFNSFDVTIKKMTNFYGSICQP